MEGQGIQNIQQQMLGQAMGSIGGQPMVQYQQQTQQVYQQSLGLQQVDIKNWYSHAVKHDSSIIFIEANINDSTLLFVPSPILLWHQWQLSVQICHRV